MSDLFNPWETGIKDPKLGTYYRSRVVERAPLAATVPTAYVASALPNRRLRWLSSVMMIGCAVLLLRVAWLQLVRGADYRQRADENRIQTLSLPAARGIIFDATGVALVGNVPNFVATITPSELPTAASQAYLNTLRQIADALGLSLEQLSTDVADHANRYYQQPLVVREFIPHDEALSLITTLDQVAGVQIEAQASRNYLRPELYAHLLGYLGRISPADLATGLSDAYDLSDQIGKTGLELTYEDSLRGTKGTIAKEITAHGQAVDVIAEEAAIPGNNIVLTIDDQLQTLLYEAVKAEVDRSGSSGGAAIALDPRTGAVRALVSYPSYDPNVFIQGITQETYAGLLNDPRKPLFNRAISGEYPSGSTFKLVVASAALQAGVVTTDTVVHSTGGLCVNCAGNSPDFPDWKPGGHGSTDIYKAIAESVNTYFYLAGGGSYDRDQRKITGGLGIDRIYTYAELFGLGQTSGISLPGEAEGFIPTPEWKQAVKGEPWYLGDTYHVSIGQGDLLVTPLQVALFTSIVANGGTLYQPQLVDHTTDQSAGLVDQVAPVVLRDRIVDDQYLQAVRAGMRQAVTSGSARSMNSLGITSAGKTGTAQIGGSVKTHSWYTTFLPYEEPKLVLTVLIEEGGEGTEAAVPVAKTVLNQLDFSKFF